MIAPRALAPFLAGLMLAAATAVSAAPLPGAKNADEINAGLQAMRDYNLIVLKDLQSSSEVQGRTFVGGNLSGGSSNYNTKPGDQKGAALSVAGDMTGSAKNINNGGDLQVGGNLDSGANMNGGGDVAVEGNVTRVNANGASVYAGGNVTKTNAKDIYYGGSIDKNSNGAKHAGDKSADGLQLDLQQLAADFTAELIATSDYLSGLEPTSAISYAQKGQQAVFDAGSDKGVAVFSIADLGAALKSSSQLIFAPPSSYDLVIINVGGRDVSLPGGINFNGPTGLGGKVIWNFYEAEKVNLGSKSWYGSVLAPNADLKFNTFIEGSVVAKFVQQNGAVRMGGFSSGSLVPSLNINELRGAIPEPATWAMMIMGFGAIGAAIRRRRAMIAA